VGVGLMAHVEEDAVFGRVKNPVQRHHEFNGPEARGQMPPVLGADPDDLAAEFLGQGQELLFGEGLEVSRAIHSV